MPPPIGTLKWILLFMKHAFLGRFSMIRGMQSFAFRFSALLAG